MIKSPNPAGWSDIPTSEGWWFDDESQSWENMFSADLATALVEDWSGLWYGPIIIPEKPNTERSNGAENLPLPAPTGSASELLALLMKAREYVDAYVENRDVPAGVTGGLRIIEDIDDAVRMTPNSEVSSGAKNP